MSILIAALVLAAVIMWAGWCNGETYNQRVRMIYAARNSLDFEAAFARYESVTYDQHFWCLMTFRTPPYPPTKESKP